MGIERERRPVVAADAIIEVGNGGIVLIKRRNPPHGWAIAGGFVDFGESVEHAAIREAKEETGLDVELLAQLYTYSDPRRDPRGHTITVVFVARAAGTPVAGDDAAEAGVFTEATLPAPLVFDHPEVLADYFAYKRTGSHPLKK